MRATWQVSARRACKANPINRSNYCYSSKRTGQAQLKTRIREIVETRVRYGYRRIHILLRREECVVIPKRVHRHVREMGLQLRNKTPIRRVKAKVRSDRSIATQRGLGDGLCTRSAFRRSQTAGPDDRGYDSRASASHRSTANLSQLRCHRNSRKGDHEILNAKDHPR